jgi:hypothetical protein
MRRSNAETIAAAFALALSLGGCTALLGLDDKVYTDEDGGSVATGTGGAGGAIGSGGAGGLGGGAGGSGGAGGGSGGSGGGPGCPIVPANGAPGQSLWVQTSTSSQPASVSGVAVDACGDVWVTAKFSKDIKISDCPLRLSDAGGAIFVAKLNGATGACKLSSVFGGANSGDFAEPRAIALDSAGNAVIVGQFRGYFSPGDFSGMSQNDSYDPFVLKLGQDGTPSWLKTWGSDLDDGLNAVATDPIDSGFVVAGSVKGTMLIDTGAGVLLMSSAGSSDILLAKLDKDGFSQWAHRFGATGTDVANSVTVRNISGAIGLAGIVTGMVDFLQKSVVTTGNPDAFAAAFDSTAAVCTFAFSPIANPSASGLGAAWTATSGQLAVVGELNGVGSFGGTNLQSAAGDSDSFLALLDSTGGGANSATRIGQAPGGPMASPDRVNAVAAVPDSKHVVIAGSFRDAAIVGSKTVTSAGGDDILVARLDEALKTAWARSIGDVMDQEATAVAVDPVTGAPVIGGRFSGSVNFGVGAVTSTIVPQMFVLKLAP